jgi:DNA-binding transcriptional MerR regulator
MTERLFQSSEAIKILWLTQRQVIHWAEKGLVIPEVDAEGAGSKRKYSYTNLLEYGLCKALFDMGLGIYKVKRILQDLREDGDLKAWAENYKSYWTEYFHKMHLKAFKMFNEQIQPIVSDPKIFDDPKLAEEWLEARGYKKQEFKAENPMGILIYQFRKDGSNQRTVYPATMDSLIKRESKPLFQFRSLIIVDLGEIKGEIDEAIDSL